MEACSSSVLPRGRRNRFAKLLLLGLVAAVVGTVPASAPARAPKAGKWVGTTSQGLPLSFKLNKKLRVTQLSFPIKPVQCSNGPMPESFYPEPWPLGRKVKKYRRNGKLIYHLSVRIHRNLYTSDANFLVDYFLEARFNRKGTRLVNAKPVRDYTYLLIAFEFAGPNNEVGYCGTDCEPGDHPMYCGDRISFLPLDWRAHKKR